MTARQGSLRAGFRGAAALALLLTVTGTGPAVRGEAAAPAGDSATRIATSGTTSWSGVRWGDYGWGDKRADRAAQSATGAYDATKDTGSLSTVTKAIGARDVWTQRDADGRAITGQGVTVALLDTGVADVPGLTADSKVVQGPDLSLETNSADLRGGDNFGHGTHLAGIIAAKDAVQTDPRTGEPKPSSAAQELGVAPDAKVLSVKLATRDGSTDVSQVIAALDWVVAHRNDNGMAIRVVNLSYGTYSTQSYRVDPLAAAAENAWRNGVVVVVSGGNDGADAGGLTDPAIDPYIISVGASDPNGSVSGWNAPSVADFSSRGTYQRHVDLLAPGRSIAALRAPGSFVDVNNPQGLVTGDTTGRLFRGSGTSQAAAVVSGAAALLLQANPSLTPDQVKAALTLTAVPVAGDVRDTGAGELDVAAAVRFATRNIPTLNSLQKLLLRQVWPVSTGSGSLETARGGSHLVDPETGAVLQGEVDVQGQPWDPASWYASSISGTAWTGGIWNGARWTGDSWSGARWTSVAWDGARWTGARWTDVSWDGARWTGARWTDLAWDGARWTDKLWT